jgi:hypothetical protein
MKPEQALFADVSVIIEQGRGAIIYHAKSVSVSMFWRIGNRVNADVLGNERAEYGKRIVSRLATQLAAQYGRSKVFEAKMHAILEEIRERMKLRKMLQPSYEEND